MSQIGPNIWGFDISPRFAIMFKLGRRQGAGK